MFLVNSRSPRFSATTSRSTCESSHKRWHTFSRSYGVNLPSSLTRVLSSALGFSPYLPVSVYGTVTYISRYEAFPGSMGSTTLRKQSLLRHHALMLIRTRICLSPTSTRLNRDFQHPDGLPFCVPPSLKRYICSTGILTCFPSPTPLGLGLGTD